MPDSMLYGLNLAMAGLLIVFIVLALISGIVAMMRWMDGMAQRRSQAKQPVVQKSEQTIDDLTLVLITAAVATALTGRFRIRSIRRILHGNEKIGSWSTTGRAILHGSHVVPKNRPK